MAKSQHKSEEYIQSSDESDTESIPQFTPPKNFKLSKPKDKLKSSIFKNKQLFLIKTPKNFPISKLKQLPIESESEFKFNNANYKFQQDLNGKGVNEITKHTIFIPNNSHFKPINSKINKFYSISQVVDIPEIDIDKVVIPRRDVEKVGQLKMRHYPTGYGAEDYKEQGEEEEDDDEGKVLKRAKVSEHDSKDVLISEQKSKKDKKDKKEKKDRKDKKDKKRKDKS